MGCIKAVRGVEPTEPDGLHHPPPRSPMYTQPRETILVHHVSAIDSSKLAGAELAGAAQSAGGGRLRSTAMGHDGTHHGAFGQDSERVADRTVVRVGLRCIDPGLADEVVIEPEEGVARRSPVVKGAVEGVAAVVVDEARLEA